MMYINLSVKFIMLILLNLNQVLLIIIIYLISIGLYLLQIFMVRSTIIQIIHIQCVYRLKIP